MEFLSVISKGTTQEKIMWSFEFLDLDKNGYIEKQEMLKVKIEYCIQYLEKSAFLRGKNLGKCSLPDYVQP